MDIRDILAGLDREDEQANARLRELIEAAETTETRALTDEQTAEFDTLTADIDARADRRARLQAQLAREDQAAQRAAAVAASTRHYGQTAQVTREDGPYTPTSAMNRGPSFFRDLVRMRKGDAEALDRLTRNNAHVAAYSTRAGISTVTGSGGEFVPPLWLEQDVVPLARPGRVTANLTQQDALPEGTDSINIPKVASGTAVALQGTPTGGQNQAIVEQDLTTTSVSSGVYTVAGGQTVSMQLIEQSPVNIDRIVFTDLQKVYDIQVDNFVLSGTGSNQPQGILSLTGRQADQVATATSTAIQVYKLIANQIAAIQTSRFDSPTHIVMHPRRWYWFLTATDNNGRPLVLPKSLGQYNALGDASAMNNTQGVVGEMLGLPVVVDPNIPITLPDANSTPANDADVIVVAKFDDLWLWESVTRAEAFEQTYAQNLSLFLRLYGYQSFQPARYPQSVGLITKLSNLS